MVVKLVAKGDNLLAHKDIAGRNAGFQNNALQRGTTAQRDIRLPTRKDSTSQINHHTAERQPLALVHRDGPRQLDRQLFERPHHLLFDALLRLIVFIFIITPRRRLDQMLLSILEEDVDFPIIRDARNHADGTIHPTPLAVILNENNLRLFFQRKFQRSRQGGFREIARDFAGKHKFLARQFFQFTFVDEINLVATRG